MKRVPWAVLEGPWRTSSSSKLNRALLRLIHLSSPSSHTKTCSINKCVYLPDTDVLDRLENIEQKSKKIPGTHKLHYSPSQGCATLLHPMVCKQERCCHLRARNRRCWWQPLCFVPWRVSAKKRRMDTVSGIASAEVSRTVFFQLVHYLDYFY